MVIPLLLFAGSIIADLILQYYFDQEEKKREMEYLQQGYSPEEVGGAVGYRNDIPFEDEDIPAGDGTDYLRRALFG